MALTLEDLTTPLTVEEVTTSMYDVLGALGVNTTNWKPGAVVRTIIAVAAIGVAALSALIAKIARAGWLEYAEKDWLTLVARHVFGVERPTATFAQGLVNLVNGGGGVFDWGPGDLIVKNSTTGKTYRNTQTLHLGSLATLSNVAIIAVELGSDSSSNPGAIDSFETAAIGVSVTNPTSVIGLDDASDPALRTLCLEKRSSLSPNGPRDAYAFFARTARTPDGVSCGVTRVHVTKTSSIGKVTVTVGSDSGGISGVVTDPTTPLGAIDFAIRTNVVPDGVTVVVESAAVGLVNVAYLAYMYSTANLSAAAVQELIATKLKAFCQTQPLGGNVIGTAHGKVFVEAIKAAILSVRPEIFHVQLFSPLVDLDMFGTPVKSPVLGSPVIGQVVIVQPS